MGGSSQYGGLLLSTMKGRATMTIDSRLAFGISAAALLFSLAFGSACFAQDSMQLDTMFRESLSGARDVQQRREEDRRRVPVRRDSKGAQEADRREPKR
jgi:hypothetical protein